MALLLALRTQDVTVDSKAFAELPVPTLKSNTTIGTNNNVTMTVHTTNSIQQQLQRSQTRRGSYKKGNSKQY